MLLRDGAGEDLRGTEPEQPRTAAREATRGLDGTGKISKDMAMTAMPRIDARRSCVNQGCGVAEQ